MKCNLKHGFRNPLRLEHMYNVTYLEIYQYMHYRRMPLYVYAQRIPFMIVHSPNLPVKICHVCIRGSGACEANLLFVSRLISFQTVSANRAISQVSKYTWTIPILHVTSVRRITYGFRDFMWFCNIHFTHTLKGYICNNGAIMPSPQCQRGNPE